MKHRTPLALLDPRFRGGIEVLDHEGHPCPYPGNEADSWLKQGLMVIIARPLIIEIAEKVTTRR